MEVQRSLIADVESAIASGSADQRVQTLRRITDLFMASAENYSDQQVELFDDVILRLADKIEMRARAELASRLAPVANAPTEVVRRLARDKAIAVAGPVLTQSPRLTEAELLAFAKEDDDQARLLAISKRRSLSEPVGDMLAVRGNREVVHSVAGNAGARFSSKGFGTLVERSSGDDELALTVGLRQDIPKEQFQALVAKASEAVFNRLASSNPAAAADVHRVLVSLTGEIGKTAAKIERNYVQAKAAVDELKRSGKPFEAAIQVYAGAGKVEETIVAVSHLSQIPVETVEGILLRKQLDLDVVLVILKSAGLSWPTAKLILELRSDKASLAGPVIANARQHFERLQVSTAQRVVRFYQARSATRQTLQ